MAASIDRLAFEPRNADEAWRLAEWVAGSRCFTAQTPEQVYVLIHVGRELGLSAMQSVRGIYVVSGKPVISADLLVSVMINSGKCDFWTTEEDTPERVTIATRRRGTDRVERRTWTIEDARRAGLVGKDIWARYPAQMLSHRAAADLARRVYPDVLFGVYTPDEAEDFEGGAATVGTPPALRGAQQVTPGLPAPAPTPPASAAPDDQPTEAADDNSKIDPKTRRWLTFAESAGLESLARNGERLGKLRGAERTLVWAAVGKRVAALVAGFDAATLDAARPLIAKLPEALRTSPEWDGVGVLLSARATDDVLEGAPPPAPASDAVQTEQGA
jgi:hypothetical protein